MEEEDRVSNAVWGSGPGQNLQQAPSLGDSRLDRSDGNAVTSIASIGIENKASCVVDRDAVLQEKGEGDLAEVSSRRDPAEHHPPPTVFVTF